MWTSKKMAIKNNIWSRKRARTETDSSNILLRIKHSIVIIVEKCFGISLHPFLRCLDEEQAHYKPFSHCQYHASVSFEDGNTYHWCFCKGKLLTLVISVWGTDITREMCLGAHISRGNTYHCNTVPQRRSLSVRGRKRSVLRDGKSLACETTSRQCLGRLSLHKKYQSN